MNDRKLTELLPPEEFQVLVLLFTVGPCRRGGNENDPRPRAAGQLDEVQHDAVRHVAAATNHQGAGRGGGRNIQCDFLFHRQARLP
jgi:hypothetical protein